MSNLLYWSLTGFWMISKSQSIINKSVLSSFKLQPLLLIVSLPSLPSPTSLTARSSIIHQIEVSWPDTATTTATIATVTFQTASDQLPPDDLPCRHIQSKSEFNRPMKRKPFSSWWEECGPAKIPTVTTNTSMPRVSLFSVPSFAFFYPVINNFQEK